MVVKKITANLTLTYQDLLPTILTFEDVNKMVDIILLEINNKNIGSSKKLIDLDGGYVVNAEYIQSLIVGSNNYLRNLSRTLKQKLNKNYTSKSIHLSDNDVCKSCVVYADKQANLHADDTFLDHQSV